jgi:poly-gamma-glutamate synthesis protein (capsule biosynthesis protein)
MSGRGIDQILTRPSEPRLYEPSVKDARTYVSLAEAASGDMPRSVPPAYIWGDALGELERRQPAARIINLETSVTGSGDYWDDKEIHYRMHPDNVACLTAARIDVAVLANNHVLDWGHTGLVETIATLTTAGIKTVGAGANLEEARRPAYVDLGGGGRLIVCGMASLTSGVPPSWTATERNAGIDVLRDLSDATAAEIGERVRRVKRPGHPVIASIHWGSNWGYEVPAAFVRFAHSLIDGGVDLVHGHSSHHVRPIEVYRNRLILYGCGDFIHDYEGIRGYEEFRNDLAVMYFATIDPASGELARLGMVPMQIRKFSLHRAGTADVRWLEHRITEISARFGCSLERAGDDSLVLRWKGSGRAPPPAGRSPITLCERLGFMLDWYGGMITERTGRLAYTYDPETDVATADGSPIRDIASIWDVELLSRFLARSDLLPLVERSLTHYAGDLVRHDGALILDSDRLGEPSGIAHSAFMILALLHADHAGREATAVALAEGILRQQRHDGSYKVYFGAAPDDGLELYPGEAMLALMEVHALTDDARYVNSVERGFRYCRDRFPPHALGSDLRVFYANWQSQYAAPLHARTQSDTLRREVGDYVFALHDRILEAGFYDAIERYPMRQATVEVACGLEGLNDAYTIAARERDGDRVRAYERCIRVALAWLFRAQRLEHCTPREKGGFGHSLADRTQRIDVTGHVLAGFIKSLQNGVGG